MRNSWACFRLICQRSRLQDTTYRCPCCVLLGVIYPLRHFDSHWISDFASTVDPSCPLPSPPSNALVSIPSRLSFPVFSSSIFYTAQPLKLQQLSRLTCIISDRDSSFIICLIAIAYSVGQIINSVCLCQCVCPSVCLSALSRSHFLISFTKSGTEVTIPHKVRTSLLGSTSHHPSPILPPNSPILGHE